jgi:hypothetical protein
MGYSCAQGAELGGNGGILFNELSWETNSWQPIRKMKLTVGKGYKETHIF